MFVSFQDKDKKTVHTHTSLIEDEKAERIKALYDYKSTVARTGAFLTFYASMEIVNRVKVISNLMFPIRAGIVAASALLGYTVAPKVWWSTTGDREVRKLLNGAPIYEDFFEVPELDKMYFWLDDDNNYEPSLWHHSV